MNIAVNVIDARLLDIQVTEDEIIANLVDGRTVSVPLAWSWRLSEATPGQRDNFEIIGDGQGIRRLNVDEDISVEECFAALRLVGQRLLPDRKGSWKHRRSTFT